MSGREDIFEIVIFDDDKKMCKICQRLDDPEINPENMAAACDMEYARIRRGEYGFFIPDGLLKKSFEDMILYAADIKLFGTLVIFATEEGEAVDEFGIPMGYTADHLIRKHLGMSLKK